MTKFINGQRLSTPNCQTCVKSFPGATVGDMADCIRPSIRRKPDEIIVHVGTKNIRSEEPRVVAEKIVKLCSQIQDESPMTEVTISSVIVRSDDSLNSKIKDMNKIVNQFAIIGHVFPTRTSQRYTLMPVGCI